MTKIAYLDCPTGIAGDMCLGALVDAGVPLDYLIAKLSQLGIDHEYQLRAEPVSRNGQQATKVHVDLRLDAALHDETDAIASTTVPHASHHHTHSATESVAATETDGSQKHLLSHSPASITNDHTHQNDRSHPDLVRHLPEVERLILAAKLPARAEAWSLAVFRKLAEAEGAIHGVPPEHVHFHEVGATDAIVDIVGTCLGLDWLDIDRLYCSPLPVGGGTIRAAHGRLPVPAPAVLKLFELRQVPIYSNGIDREMVTPTGAAIATTLATQFGSPPAMTLRRVGLGAGSISLPLPNILRLWLGEEKGAEETRDAGHVAVSGQETGFDVSAQPNSAQPNVGRRREAEGKRQEQLRTQNLEPSSNAAHLQSSSQRASATQNFTPHSIAEWNHSSPLTPPQSGSKLHPLPLIPHSIALLETQIDDLNPQAIGYIYEALFAVGALDVFTQAIAMKKSRPGILLTVVCQLEAVSACEAVIFRETTTLGIRRSTQERSTLEREMQSVQTAYGTVQVKVAWCDRSQLEPTNVQPEYEDCARIARQHNLPWRTVHQLALQAWYQRHSNAQLSAAQPGETGCGV